MSNSTDDEISAMTADELREWQSSMGWNQIEAAEALRTPYSTYQRWVSGKTPIPAIVALTCECIALLGFSPQPTPPTKNAPAKAPASGATPRRMRSIGGTPSPDAVLSTEEEIERRERRRAANPLGRFLELPPRRNY